MPDDDRTDAAPPDAPLASHEELPVVARMVVEIRSDGTRTVARGALEDVTLGQTVSIEAAGTSPAALAAALLRQVVRLPFAARATGLVRSAARALRLKARK